MSRSRKIRKILIANRGEIAVRIMRTCRQLGIATVAVFSDADRTAPHVLLADEAYRVGPPPSAESYLLGDGIVEIARNCGADAIHPGYGFLSENAAFARACEAAGIIFIGPPPDAIETMGDKTEARKMMEVVGVPMAPGTTDAIEDPELAREIARRIGYPVLIKAAAGGGGKGMRVVEDEANLQAAMRRAQSEAKSAFGDGRVFIEKYIAEPRHVEIQVLADAHGQIVHLFERECSIQRRHQKVVEEAPSPALTPALRQAMGTAAIEAARACGYVNAGTVEFLVDEAGRFYFMEMNTRLQVEHPVTEEITGVDLVAVQIRVAEGSPLPFTQDDLAIRGHAIECRIYAEDPHNDFLPDPGPLLRHAPPSGPGVRVDAGIEEGGVVEMHYDPMVAKLIVWDLDRKSAIDRMDRALAEYEIAGVQTTIPFCRFVMQHEAFRSGAFSTRFVERHFGSSEPPAPPEDVREAAAIAAALLSRKDEVRSNGQTIAPTSTGTSRWNLRRMYSD